METSTRSLTEAQLQDFERDGFLVIRQLLNPAEVNEVRDAFMELASNGPVEGLFEPVLTGDKNDPLLRYPRVMLPHRREDLPAGKLAMQFMLDSRVESILTDLFHEAPVAAQSMFYYKPAGARGQALHQDNFYLKVAPGTCMAAWVAIDDADLENGTLMVVPGSHRLDLACPQEADSTISFTSHYVAPPAGSHEVPVDLKAGDTLFFNGSLIHGSYPNTSSTRFRRALISHYLPKSSNEISEWYKPIYDFDGGIVEGIKVSTDGGPCGVEFAATGVH